MKFELDHTYFIGLMGTFLITLVTVLAAITYASGQTNDTIKECARLNTIQTLGVQNTEIKKKVSY